MLRPMLAGVDVVKHLTEPPTAIMSSKKQVERLSNRSGGGGGGKMQGREVNEIDCKKKLKGRWSVKG